MQRTLASLCFRGLVGLCAGLLLRVWVRLWCPYLEGHDEMSEMKLGLQVQLDSHIFQTCRGRAKELKQSRTPPASAATFCWGPVLWWHKASSLCRLDLMSKKGFSALARYKEAARGCWGPYRTGSAMQHLQRHPAATCKVWTCTAVISERITWLTPMDVGWGQGLLRAASWHQGARWLVRARMLSPAPRCPHTTQPCFFITCFLEYP